MGISAAARLVLSEGDKKQLMRIGRHRSTPRGIVLRVEIVRAAAEGMANRAIARKLSTSLPTVLLWRKRYEAEGLAGIVEDKPCSGRPTEVTPERGAATVYRVWTKHKLQPHRVESFKFSNDPQFALEG